MAANAVEVTAIVAYQVISTIEEALEMTGVVFAIYGALLYLAGLVIELANGESGINAQPSTSK